MTKTKYDKPTIEEIARLEDAVRADERRKFEEWVTCKKHGEWTTACPHCENEEWEKMKKAAEQRGIERGKKEQHDIEFGRLTEVVLNYKASWIKTGRAEGIDDVEKELEKHKLTYEFGDNYWQRPQIVEAIAAARRSDEKVKP